MNIIITTFVNVISLIIITVVYFVGNAGNSKMP